MTSSHICGASVLVLALALLGSTGGPSAAQDQLMRAPPGQGGGEAVTAPPAPPAQQDQTAQSAPEKGKDEDLDRARAAARAADPRLQGLEKAREAARKAQDQNGAKDCLTAREARGAVQARKAVPLSQALRAARAAWDGEVIDYKLCTFDGMLAYDLTLLNGDGRVGRVRVGAVDGKLVNVR